MTGEMCLEHITVLLGLHLALCRSSLEFQKGSGKRAKGMGWASELAMCGQ